ncbi:GNAT family N-acetyltransferase [Sporosarcina sp. JAI121]|uniref:GNAT family N-acetyltransferase n=1 Tax=Sporosarcina sp. JAI121 TaxID=2723064 RepID=UPI0015C7E731|nr:GNAT family N-acetyltransferase [Sporosarcina sp. JAI121]NYF25320.1 ribosomal protein S18 acetylase RimI-like enzyme [Sporosarcina sp. JAI121]
MLTKEQTQAIELLQHECEKTDDIKLKLNWEMLRRRDDERMDFFHEENGELVAFLALYSFGSTVEVCGVVKPGERRKRLFSNLWQEALSTIKEKGFKKILLNAPSSSLSAKEWLVTQPCEYVFSEFQMHWKEQLLEKSDDIHLRKSEPEDSDFEVQLDVLAFDVTESDARLHNDRVKNRPDEYHFIIEVAKEAIGKIRVSRMEKEAYIYGFAVLPEFQGKGYGSKALRNVVKKEHEAGCTIQLEVETKNDNALRLYESIGFVSVSGQDYYLWNE